jgi:hypothetical protein
MQKPTTDAMDEDEAGPTEVNTTKASHLVKVHKDKLTVTYNGKANHVQDVGVRASTALPCLANSSECCPVQAVQSNRPFSNKVLIGYFEMTVVNAGAKGYSAHHTLQMCSNRNFISFTAGKTQDSLMLTI